MVTEFGTAVYRFALHFTALPVGRLVWWSAEWQRSRGLSPRPITSFRIFDQIFYFSHSAFYPLPSRIR